MATTYIYTLAHPLTGYIRYVGKSNDLNNRYNLHISRDEQTKKSSWIRKLKSQNLAPVMEVIDVVPVAEWCFWECYWICQIKSWGFLLYNGDNGGLGSDRLSEETKKKISDKQKGRSAIYNRVRYEQYDLSGKLLRTYLSCKSAAAAVGLNHSNISRAAKEGWQAGGFKWTRINEPRVKKIRTKKPSYKSKVVLDTQYGIYYESATKAALSVNLSHTYLRSMLSGRQRNRTNLVYA